MRPALARITAGVDRDPWLKSGLPGSSPFPGTVPFVCLPGSLLYKEVTGHSLLSRMRDRVPARGGEHAQKSSGVLQGESSHVLSCVYLSSRVFIREQDHGYSCCPLSHNPVRLCLFCPSPGCPSLVRGDRAGHILCPPDDPLSCFCGSCIPSLSLSSTTRCAWLIPAVSCPAGAWSPAGPLVLALENGVRNQDLGAGVLGKQPSLAVSLS